MAFALPATPLEWSQTAVVVSEAVLVQVKGKSVPLYGIFLDKQYVGSFQYSTARALNASLASLKLVKRMPKFPKRSGGGEKAQRKCCEQLQAYFTAVGSTDGLAVCGAFVEFLKGLKKIPRARPSPINQQSVLPRWVSAPGLRKTELSQSMTDLTAEAGAGPTKSESQQKEAKVTLVDALAVHPPIVSPPKVATAAAAAAAAPAGTGTVSTPTRPSPYTRSPVTAPEPGAGSSPTATFFPSAATSASSAHTAAAKREALMRRRDSTPVFASGVDVSREGFDELERADRQRPTTMLQEDVEAIAEVGAAEEALAEPPSTLVGREFVRLNGPDELSCIFSPLTKVPSWFGQYYSKVVTKVDLSNCAFEDLSLLSSMNRLDSLIADSNNITCATLPLLPAIATLKTLSLNRNKIDSLLAFIGFCREKYPRLTFVSLIGNPCCADELSGHSEDDYADYRRQLVLAFPQLGWVDSTNTAKDRTIDGHMSCPNLSSTSIPTWVGQDPGVLGFDFSRSNIIDVSLLASFSKLDTLVLDYCGIVSTIAFPELPSLRALSLNFNQITDIHRFLLRAQEKFGNMTFLSLLGNPCCPSELDGNCTQEQYESYRAHVTMALPQLLHLDFRGTDYTLDPDPEWLLEDISKDSASKIVTNAGAGDFVVTKLDNTFLLILNDYGAVATFSILFDGMRFEFGGQSFWAIESVVEYVRGIELCGRSGNPLKLRRAAVLVDPDTKRLFQDDDDDEGVHARRTFMEVSPTKQVVAAWSAAGSRLNADSQKATAAAALAKCDRGAAAVGSGTRAGADGPGAEESSGLLVHGPGTPTTRVTVTRATKDMSFGFGLGQTDAGHNVVTYVKDDTPSAGVLLIGDVIVALNGCQCHVNNLPRSTTANRPGCSPCPVPGAVVEDIPIDIPRTEQLEDGHMVSALEARMLRALALIDEDDAYDHLVKRKGLTARRLAVVVAERGMLWLATEAELLEKLPESHRAAFRKMAAERVAKLDLALPETAIPGRMDRDGGGNSGLHDVLIAEIAAATTLTFEVVRHDAGIAPEAHLVMSGVMMSRVVSELKSEMDKNTAVSTERVEAAAVAAEATFAPLNAGAEGTTCAAAVAIAEPGPVAETVEQKNRVVDDEPPIDLPAPYDWNVWSGTYSRPLAVIQKSLFSAEFWHPYYAGKKYRNITIAAWKNKGRQATYTMPAAGFKPKTFVQENQEVIVDTKTVVVVQVRSTTPGVPYGSSFATQVQYRLEIGPGGATTNLLVTAQVNWVKKCALKGTITKKIKVAVIQSFEEIKAHGESVWAAN